MWTMIASHGYKYHLATETFISMCGRDDLFVMDYVELIDGKVVRIGEARRQLGIINDIRICKTCLKTVLNTNT